MQNFLSALDTDISENDLIEKILQMFSDIPTMTQAITKLKAMRQGKNETILAYNQRYKTLVEWVEGRPIEHITSPVAMKMYLGTIIPQLRKSIKNSLFWNSKHAPTTVGEAMAKAQQLYVKHLYSMGEEQDKDQKKPVEDMVINEISRKFESRYRDRRMIFVICQIIDATAMTQTKGGAKIKTAVKILTKTLQNITSHQYPLVQMIRLPRHASTLRRIAKKTCLNKCLTNDRTLIVRVRLALHSDYGKSCAVNGHEIYKLDGKVSRSKKKSPRKKALTLQKLLKTIQ